MVKSKHKDKRMNAPSVLVPQNRILRAAWNMQRHNANRRGIPFRLTFEEWLRIWKRSGKLHLRGRQAGCYVMSRKGDQGAYEVGNVRIIRMEANMLAGQKNQVWTPERRQQIAASKTGKPRVDLTELNRSRAGQPLSKEHRKNIAQALLGKVRGPYQKRTTAHGQE